jgi:tetratricopeptide (TPR) repeat protein
MQQAALAGRLRKAFAKSVELDPQHVPGLIGLARYHASAPEIAGGSLAKAREFAQRVRKLHPALGELELGYIAEREEDFATALSHFEAALEQQPQSASAHLAAGRALVKLGRKDDARRHFEAARATGAQRDAATKALAELDAK